MTSVDDLRVAVRRLVAGVAHWTPVAWSAPAPGTPAASRADAVHALVQRLADLAADAESAPRRPVPRLGNDLALPDQLRVVAADLLAVAPSEPIAGTAHTVVQATRHLLWP